MADEVGFRSLEGGHDHQLVVWENLGADSLGAPLATHGDGLGYSRATFHVFGDFSGGATVSIVGRIFPQHYETLSCRDGALVFNRPAMLTTEDVVKQIMPVVDGGDQNTKLTVAMFAIR